MAIDGCRVSGLAGVVVGFTALLAGCSPQQKPAAKPYSLPAELLLDAHAERGPEGQVYVVGSTNFPDRMKLWVHVESGRLPLGAPKVIASDENVRIHNGRFGTLPMWQEIPNPYLSSNSLKYAMRKWPDGAKFKVLKRLLQAATYKVRFIAYFNDAWQTPDVMALLAGGKDLQGKVLRLTDPDVIDSSKMLDYLATVPFPPVLPGARAIALVKGAVLTIPGHGKSAIDVETNLNLLLASGIIKPAKGWRAKAGDAGIYEVEFDFLSGEAGEKQAIWNVNLRTASVKYLNEAAKITSWSPD